MGADGASVVSPIRRAWTTIAPGGSGQVGGTFTRRRIDRIFATAAAAGCVVLGLQALLLALSNDAGLREPWSPFVVIAVFALVLAMCVSCLFERTARVGSAVCAMSFVVLLLAWVPLSTSEPLPVTPEPWLWYLVNVATVAAVVAFAMPWQIIFTLGVPVLYGVVRLLRSDGSLEAWGAIVFEVPFALILGSLLLVLATAFRRLGSGVDAARARTVAAYAAAAEAQAAQEERVSVAALMHDSVLGALIAAERAETPRARTLAASMAQEALAGLADTGGGAPLAETEPMTVREMAERIGQAARELGIAVPVNVGSVSEDAEIPAAAAQAIIRASTQAIANAIQHADARGLHVRVGPPAGVVRVGAAGPAAGIDVVVRDSGPGFDLRAIPDDRLGISASIIARMSAVGATAKIDSDRLGTRVTLRWRGAEGEGS